MSKHSEAVKRYFRRHPEKLAEANRLYYARHRERILADAEYKPEQGRARSAVYSALRRGVLVKGPCEVGVDCVGAVQAHHDDYAKPLEVRWLCRSHHQQLHRRLKEQVR